MKFKILVQQSPYGYSASYPYFPGCHSQGDTLKEALENIKDAILTYQMMLEAHYKDQEVYEVTI